ncbi:LOW QUALITY PROTEIN: protein FAM228B [Sylvia borin]
MEQPRLEGTLEDCLAQPFMGKRHQMRAAPDQSRDIIASVQCILGRENFVREVDRYLRHSDFLDLRKTELLYKKYLEDVSEPFMQKIKDQMDSQSWEEVQKRLQEQFSQYLNYSTKKVSKRSRFLSWRGLYTEDCGQHQGFCCYFLSVDNLEFGCTLPGYVFLDDYDPSEYDPLQKMCTACWKM